MVGGEVGPGVVSVGDSVGACSVGVGVGDGEGLGLGEGDGRRVGVAVGSGSGSRVDVAVAGAVVGVGVGSGLEPRSWFARNIATAAPTPMAMRMIPMTTRIVAPLTPPAS